jgi:hypothetical protein
MARALAVEPSNADILFRAAILHNHFRENEKTLDFLSKSIAAGYSKAVIRDTPDFDHLAEDPRFRKMIFQATNPVSATTPTHK